MHEDLKRVAKYALDSKIAYSIQQPSSLQTDPGTLLQLLQLNNILEEMYPTPKPTIKSIPKKVAKNG